MDNWKQKEERDCVLCCFAACLGIPRDTLFDAITHPMEREHYLCEEVFPFALAHGYVPMRIIIQPEYTTADSFTANYWQILYKKYKAILLVHNVVAKKYHALASLEFGIYDPKTDDVYDALPSHFDIIEIVFLIPTNENFDGITTGEWR